MTPDYIVLDWNEERMEVLARGHVDLEAYRAALRAEGRDADEVGAVRHIFARWTFRRGTGYDRWLEVCEGPARGAGRYTIRAGA